MRAWEWSERADWLMVATRGAWTIEARKAAHGWIAYVAVPCFVESTSVYPTLELAQRAAEAMVATLVAPFVEAEREAIHAEIERRHQANAGKSWERCFNFADLLEWLDALELVEERTR